jgi:hypothetical protein
VRWVCSAGASGERLGSRRREASSWEALRCQMGAWERRNWGRERLSGGGRWGAQRRDNVVVDPTWMDVRFSSTQVDACRFRDPEAATLRNLRRERSVFLYKFKYHYDMIIYTT